MKPATVFLGEMTNPEVEEFLKTRHTVIVPTGATEQHGPHGPLLTDVLIPQEVARRIAPTIGAVVAPPINYALSYPHVGFTGLVHVRISTFMALIEDLCASFATSGFKRIIFLNGHYDNTYAIAYGMRERRGEDAEGRQGVSGELLGWADGGRGRRVVRVEERVAREPGRDVRRARDQPEPRGHGPCERGVSAVPGVHGEHGARPYGLLLHVAGVGVLGHENRHMGRRARVHPRGRRTLHHRGSPLDACGAGQHREDLQGDAPR